MLNIVSHIGRKYAYVVKILLLLRDKVHSDVLDFAVSGSTCLEQL